MNIKNRKKNSSIFANYEPFIAIDKMFFRCYYNIEEIHTIYIIVYRKGKEMKKRLFAILASLAMLFSAMTVTLCAGRVFAQNIDTDSIIGTDEIISPDVLLGTSLEDAVKNLPDSINVRLRKGDNTDDAVLHTASFDGSGWTLHGKDAASFDGNKLSVTKASSIFRALTGDTYDDFVIETTLKGTSENINGNFGVMFRANNITEHGPDSYQGYYVGIGKNGAGYSLIIGFANNGWNHINDVKIDYKTGYEYSLKILMYGETLVVWLDGELLYKNDLSLFESGRVGVRTYNQLFECSSFTVKSPSTNDLADAGIVEYETVSAELDAWTSSEYDKNTEGSYTFKTKIKGTDYEVSTKVNVVRPFQIDEELKALSYKDVDITDGFFREYIKQMICKVVPTAIANVEKGTGGMPNIINAAKKNRGEQYSAFSGAFYVDSDVHKVLESMCYALSIDPMGDEEILNAQSAIRDKLEEWIPYYVDAQEESGYFNTYFTLDTSRIKFSDVGMCELYCMGHFIEAAIAHYECTDRSDTRLLDVAVKCADYLSDTFGTNEGQRKQIAGHQEIEIALLRLARCVTDLDASYSVRAHKYASLAAFFLEVRGDFDKRTVPSGSDQYWQDHAKVEKQYSAVGHAVRAQYMYTAMAELASIDTEYKDKYDKALTALWNDVTKTKQYVTGGVGQTSYGEGFLGSYILPNATAYCETCAGIANMMWNRSMSKIYTSSEYADMVETDIYNAVLGCVNLDGDKFYYVNSLASSSGDLRSSWYGTACCPPNLTRTVLSLSGYIYNYSDSALYVNQYITNKASVSLSGKNVGIAMTSAMPWNGDVGITLSMSGDASFKIYLRTPYWTDNATVKINENSVNVDANEQGYIVLDRTWSDGDKIDVEFSMPIIFEETDEKVKENIGHFSIRRGPIVYCAEAADNDFNVIHAYVDKSSEVKLEWTDSLDGKEDPYNLRDMYTIKMKGFTDDLSEKREVEWTFIPFYARLNREQGAMTVYVAEKHIDKKLNQYASPSASFTSYFGDSPYHLNDGSNELSKRWTSWKDGTFLTNPWVQYDFDTEVALKGCKIWWYDDGGGVRLPEGFEIYYKNNEVTKFTAVSHDNKYTCDKSSGFITYYFDDVEVTSLRIVIRNTKAAPGIVEWELIGAKNDTPKPPVTTTIVQTTTVVPTTTVTPTTTEAPTTTPGGAQPDVTTSANGTTENRNEGETPSSVLPAILIGGAIVAVAAIGAAAVIITKKKKK